jgi:four helix bundle protein
MKDDKTLLFKKRLYTFVLKLIGMLDSLPKDSVSYRIGDQLLRSGTGILGTYVEGLSASSKKEFLNYINISLKSSNESKVWVAILRDTKRLNVDDANFLLSELEEFSKILAASILTLKGKRKI